MLNFLYNRSAKIGGLIALVIAFNVFSTLPMSLQHPAEDSAGHEMALSADDYSSMPLMDMHEHVEICGMKTCSVTTENFHKVDFALISSELEFPSLPERLEGVSHNPPSEPPKV